MVAVYISQLADHTFLQEHCCHRDGDWVHHRDASPFGSVAEVVQMFLQEHLSSLNISRGLPEEDAPTLSRRHEVTVAVLWCGGG